MFVAQPEEEALPPYLDDQHRELGLKPGVGADGQWGNPTHHTLTTRTTTRTYTADDGTLVTEVLLFVTPNVNIGGRVHLLLHHGCKWLYI